MFSDFAIVCFLWRSKCSIIIFKKQYDSYRVILTSLKKNIVYKPISDNLYRLANSLSVHEAGYCTGYINRLKITQGKNYIFIINTLRKQEAYDEDALKKACNDRDISTRFSYHKGLLYDYVLNGLIACRAQASTEHEVFRCIAAATILSRKNLFALALKELDKASQQAAFYEKHYLLLQVLETQRKLMKQTSIPGLEQKLEANRNQKKEVIAKIENEDHFASINDRVYLLYREMHVLKNDHKLSELEEVMQCPSLKNKASALTFDSKLRYHYIHSHYNQLKGNYSAALEHREAALQLWNNAPHMVSENPMSYRHDLSNLLSMRNVTGNYKDFEQLLSRIEKMENTSPDHDAATFREVYYLRMLYLLNTGKKEEALQLIPAIEKGLIRYAAFINPSRLLNFYYNNIITCFLCKHYKEALRWTDKLIETGKNKNVRIDLTDFASILEIILYFETGKHDLVQYRLRNTQARLKKNNKLHAFEKLVLNYINRIILCKEKEPKTTKTWQAFQHELQQLTTLHGTDKLLGLEEVNIWVKEKA